MEGGTDEDEKILISNLRFSAHFPLLPLSRFALRFADRPSTFNVELGARNRLKREMKAASQRERVKEANV